jgi:hypothetical protein
MSQPPGPPPGSPEEQGGYPPAYPPPSYGQQPLGGPPPYPMTPVTNGKATAALITGITTLVLSWCCGLGVFGLVAVVLGAKARSEIRLSGGAQEGEGLALAGIITGSIAVVLGVLIVVAIVIAVAAGVNT